MEQVVELVPFLRDPKKEVRTIAVQNLAAFSSNSEAQELLLSHPTLIGYLKILLSDVDFIAREAYVCFLQFSSNSNFARKMITANLIPLLMEVVCDKESLFVEVALLILGNLTRTEEGSRVLMQEETSYEGVYVYKLIGRFYQGEKVEDPKQDKFKWVASIMTNLSQLEKGREILLKDEAKLLLLIASANISNHPIRTRGIAATIKNCCFRRSCHQELLDRGILNFLVVPIVTGPENFTFEEVEGMPITAKALLLKDHDIEKDKETILSLLESLVLLASTTETREFMRNASLYPILREFDNKQEDEQIKETVLKVVDLLVRDEEGPTDTVSEPTKDDDDEEEIDDKIQELGLD